MPQSGSLNGHKEALKKFFVVTPAQAGIQRFPFKLLDSGFR